MISDWTKNLKTDEEKQRFENTVLSAKPVLNRLREIVDEKEAALDRDEASIKSFDTPNWAYKQAFKNGIRHANSGFKTLINLDPKE